MSAILFGVGPQASGKFWLAQVPGCDFTKYYSKVLVCFLPKQSPRQGRGDREFNCELTPGDGNKGEGGMSQGGRNAREGAHWAGQVTASLLGNR